MIDNSLQQHILRVMTALGIDVRDIELRKRYLEFTEADSVALEHLRQPINAASRRVVEDFYVHLRQFEATAQLLAKEGVQAHLQDAQTAYIDGLTRGDYGMAYVRERMEIGIAHQRAGLAPRWYIGAYCKLLASLLPEVVNRHAGDPERTISSVNALLKIMFFDMSLAIDTYIHTNEQTRLELASVIQQTADSVAITDREGVIEYINPAFEKLTGYSSSEAIGQRPNLVKSGRHSEAFYKRIWETIRSGQAFTGVFINRNKHGDFYHEEKTITPLRDALGHVTHFVSTGRDVTERVRVEDKLDYLAHYDALTELPNRLLFTDRLKQALGRAARRKQKAAVLFLDLDRFKQINDTLGHDIGDMLLQVVSKRMAGKIRTMDSIARFGGDEFAILLEDVASSQAMPTIAQEILDALKDPFIINEREIYITTSIGICLYPDDGTDPQTLLKNADTAMYRAKAQGKNTYRFYTADMNAKALERLTMESSLRRALERKEFVLHYQPQIDIRSDRIIGVEALLRWAHPELGMIAPSEFVPLLEDTGLIVPVGEWVIQEALAQILIWRSAGYGGLRVAINLAPDQVLQADIVSYVENKLLSTGSLQNARLLEFEITESLLMDKVPEIINKLNALHEMGSRLSLDDFGTGYSSLSYLKRFPIDTIKIDRSFVGYITTNPDDAAITSAVIAMARSLKLSVIAEGVETEAQLAFLRNQGCDTVQGNLFSPALGVGQITRMLAATTTPGTE